MLFSIWYDSKQNNLISTMVRNADQTVIDHYATKFSNLTLTSVDKLPEGFQCGDIATRRWRYNSDSKSIEEIIPSDAEKLSDAKILKITEIKKITGEYILGVYPLQKQLNIIRAGTTAERAAMTAYIDPARAVSDAAEVEVVAKDTLAKVEGYTFQL